MQLTVVIEKNVTEYFGTVKFEGNLIVSSAYHLPSLEIKLKKLLRRFHKIDNKSIVFKYKYDLTVLFDVFDFLKISNVAKEAHLNPSLLRQYVIGNKQPSAAQIKRIEDTIHSLATKMASIKIAKYE